MFGNFSISSLFGGSRSGSFGGLSSIDFSEYRMIKSGSYKKLMKAYYAEQKGTGSSKKSNVLNKLVENKNTNNTKDTALTRMKTEADSLKAAAEEFDKADVFQQTDGEYDTDKILKTVNDFADQYNHVIDQSAKTVSGDVAKQTEYMQKLTDTMTKELEKVGITVGKDGKLNVNEDKFKSADMKDVKALFAGKHSYAGEIAGKALSIGKAAYMSNGIYGMNGTYSNYGKSYFDNRV